MKTDTMIYITYYRSPFGQMTLASDGECLIGLWFKGQKYMLGSFKDQPMEPKELPVFDETRRWLDVYFQGRDPGYLPSIRLTGSAFRQAVGRIMLTIPYGKTMTYGQIAAQLARLQGRDTMSAQAVGGAVGHNPISVIVPCHRVMGSDGSLTGYAGGIDLKARLLDLEGVKCG